MAQTVNFTIKLTVGGKEQVVGVSTSVGEQQQALSEVGRQVVQTGLNNYLIKVE